MSVSNLKSLQSKLRHAKNIDAAAKAVEELIDELIRMERRLGAAEDEIERLKKG